MKDTLLSLNHALIHLPFLSNCWRCGRICGRISFSSFRGENWKNVKKKEHVLPRFLPFFTCFSFPSSSSWFTHFYLESLLVFVRFLPSSSDSFPFPFSIQVNTYFLPQKKERKRTGSARSCFFSPSLETNSCVDMWV